MLRRTLAALLAFCLSSSLALAAGCEEDVRALAHRFGSALSEGKPAALRPILPVRGKVHLVLDELGPERGHFSRDQVEALFVSCLSERSVESFEVVALECDRETFALVRARASVGRVSGEPERLDLHLSFRPEDGSWVLREIREIRP